MDTTPERHGRGATHTKRDRNLDRAAAIRALTGGQQTIYAMRLTDGTVKIGCTGDLATRRRMVEAGAEVIGFMPGTFEDEAAIHKGLVQHRARGREYYRPSQDVLDVVNTMRSRFSLPPLSE